MRAFRLIGLGARLATAGGRPARIRLGLMALGFAIGSGLLLAAMSVPPAMQARDARQNALYGSQVPLGRAEDALLVWSTLQRYGDERVEVHVSEQLGRAPTPPGLARPPSPGEMFISEALVERWGGPLGEALEGRLGGTVAGSIAPEGVEGPTTLWIWLGKPTHVSLRPREAIVIESFSPVRSDSGAEDLGAILTIVGIAVAVLLPIWLFIATATRLSSATRQERLAAVRLAGGTEGEVRALAAVEAGVAAMIGSLLGIPLFLAVRPTLASGMILEMRFYASDFTPPLGFSVALLIGLPVIATVMSLVAMQRLLVSPLGVARRTRIRHAGWWWSVVLGAGIAMLAWSASRHDDFADQGARGAGSIIGTALTLTAFGLIGTATWASWGLAQRLAGRARSVSALLGMRRLEADPASTGRVVGGVALVIAMVGVLHSGLVVAREEAGAGLPRWTQELSPDTLIVHTTEVAASRELSRLEEIPGVDSVRVTRRTPYGGVSTRPTGIVRTDGRDGTLEAIRDRMAWSADVYSVQQLREGFSGSSAEFAAISQGLWLLTVFLLLVNAGTLLIAMVDWIIERRRSLSILSAVGVQASVLRRSILAQVALPLATSVAFGLAGSIVVVKLLYSAVEGETALPLRELALLSVAAAAMVLGITALSMPWMSVARSPALLRGE